MFSANVGLVKVAEKNNTMESTPSLSWQEFMQVHMHVGTILRAEPFPEARNPSYRLVIDFGPLGTRKSSAQITDKYIPADLVGQQIVAVLNFTKTNR